MCLDSLEVSRFLNGGYLDMKDRISKMMMIFSFQFLNCSKVKCQKSYFDRHASFGGYNVDIKRKFRLEC